MKPEIATLWITALRSGKYEQTQEFLNVNGAMCCLGVLCDLHAKATGSTWEDGDYMGEDTDLPTEVAKWAGMNAVTSGGLLTIPVAMTTDDEDEETFKHLALLNDHGMSFIGIANVIEQQQETL